MLFYERGKPFITKDCCINCMWYIYTGCICMGSPLNKWLIFASTPPLIISTSDAKKTNTTFNKILTASTPTELLAAYKTRYRYMLKVEKQYKEKQK